MTGQSENGYRHISSILKSVGGVKVSIVAFQAIDPGSIPGWRTVFGLSFTIIAFP